jgi:mono/diheme cytochrome c family protein
MKYSGIVFMLALAVVVSLSTLAFTSIAQNSNSSRTTNKNQTNTRQIGGIGGLKSGGGQQDFSKNTWELPDDADRTKNPVASSEESILQGKSLYLNQDKGNCIFCHGETGSGNEANFPRLRRKPADISNKERMSSMTDGEVFWKISKGINGIMPAGDRKMTEQERWHVVNYVRTLAKEPAKP